MSSTLTAVGSSPGSFCKPSRGPTSTTLTNSGTVFRSFFERDELGALEHLVAGGVVDLLHPAVGRRRDRVLHLHRLENEERLAFRHLAARFGHHLDDFPRHRRGERARMRRLVRARELLLQGEAPVLAFGEDM